MLTITKRSVFGITKKQVLEKFIEDNLENIHKVVGIYIKNPHDAEDAVYESIEKALRNAHTIRELDSIKVWFYKIVINTSINHLKRNAKTISLSSNSRLNYFDNFSMLEFKELLVVLPDIGRKITYLRFCDDYSIKEIAYELGMNENTVKSHLYRSLKKLRLEIASGNDMLYVKPIRSRGFAKALSTWIIVCIVLTASIFNLFPSLAIAAYDIPVIGKIVKVITFNRFVYKEKGYEAEIIVPQIQGLLDSELEKQLNEEFHDYANDLILSFEESILEMSELDIDEFNGNPAHMSIKADYEVKTDNDTLLSIDAYLYSDVNGYAIHKFCTIDKLNGKTVTLPELFKPNADYISCISDYIISEMTRLNEEEDKAYSVGDDPFIIFTAIRPDHSFYINESGSLVICFDKYEVAPGFYGSPEFIIPYETIQDISNSHLLK